METLKIDILNPKVKSILKDLAELDLIRIRKEDPSQRIREFKQLLSTLRERASDAPSLEEITKEVEAIRKARYEEGNS